MSDSEVDVFLAYVQRACSTENGNLLAACFNLERRLQSVDSQALLRALNQLDRIPKRLIPSIFIGDVAELVLKSIHAMDMGEHGGASHSYTEALRKLSEGVQLLQKGNENTNAGWLVPVIKLMVKQGFILAKRADMQGENQDSFRRSYHHVIMLTFNVCCSSTADITWRDSTKRSALYIVNYILVLLFQLKTLKSCGSIISRLEALYWPSKGDPPKQGTDIPQNLLLVSEMVMFKYYIGRLRLIENRFIEAKQALTSALERCHRNATRNKRRILILLIPVNLYFGRLPTMRLLRKHNLQVYAGFVTAIRFGSIRTFNETLHRYQVDFIRSGTFLLLERIKPTVYRNFLKKYQIFFRGADNLKSVKSPILNLEWVLKALQMQGENIDMDELECVICNLIFQGLIRGYLSHNTKKLVLAKALSDAFPTDKVIISLETL